MLLTLLVEQEIDLENVMALEDLKFSVQSVDVKQYEVKDISSHFDEQEFYEAEMMDALEEYHRH